MQVQDIRRPDNMERIATPEQAQAFIAEQVKEIRAQVGDKKVLLALSGGVDSSVVAALLIKAIGQNLVCVHVNHGLLRKGEPEQVIEVFRNQMNANLIYVDAVDRFLDKLAGVDDPEQKRHIIGEEFIDGGASPRRCSRCPPGRKIVGSYRVPSILRIWRSRCSSYSSSAGASGRHRGKCPPGGFPGRRRRRPR